MKLRLADWASLAEILSGAAVVVTLIVLIAEVDGNTEATLAANRQSLASRAEGLLMQQAADGDLAALIDKAERGTALDSVEVLRYAGFIGARLRNAEEAFLQFQDGHLSEQYFLTRGAVVLNTINNPQAREIWSRWRENGSFTPEFSAWIDQALTDEHGQ